MIWASIVIFIMGVVILCLIRHGRQREQYWVKQKDRGHKHYDKMLDQIVERDMKIDVLQNRISKYKDKQFDLHLNHMLNLASVPFDYLKRVAPNFTQLLLDSGYDPDKFRGEDNDCIEIPLEVLIKHGILPADPQTQDSQAQVT